ncbi:hypothetical protein RYZ27_09950 [Hyphomonas sp. FCG-A18]|uniref:hypothetical protein n=1 Tax=Hyphomonas sp. FCG-A18 TaxID=3080019 RepID=UPI002B2BBFA9|nr:hypothetical protein RYZ27_09950 [Hyphomonas sp. FCG-A18]
MSIILALSGIFYFKKVIDASRVLGETAPPIMPFVIAFVVIIIVASTVAMSVIGAASPDEANAPADEREQIILDRAGHWAGYVMGAGVVAGLFHFWVQGDGNLLFHICFASLLLGQIAEYCLQISFYRLGIR